METSNNNNNANTKGSIMTKHILRLMVIIAFFGLCNYASAETEVNIQSLLDEMINRENVARWPQPSYTCKQVSSYDRGAKAPGKPSWFANGDASSFIRTEKHGNRKEYVICDIKGPGAIVRFWMTKTKHTGTIRVYLDGADAPIIEKPIDKVISGTALAGSPLSAMKASGRNLYLPIPYAKRCKITYENFQEERNWNNDALFWQINYRTYPESTSVRTFAMSDLTIAKAKLEHVQKSLLDPAGVQPANVVFHNAINKTLDPKQTLSKTFQGPGAICKLSVKLEADNLSQALRSTILKISFDGEQTVSCPVSDFFGSGVGVNPFKGWYRQVQKDGTMTCWWVMPYRESCVVELENTGNQQVQATLGSVETCPWQWDDRSMHFYTYWRQENDIPTRPHCDWNYITIEGKGVYVGDTLALYNPAGKWWGEGDEKIYVDEDIFPSHFGTGTEDYYGYAWCCPEVFEAPFHAQPRAEGPGNQGHVTNTRSRSLDAIPFSSTFRFDMEIWHWASTKVNYAATTYWYGFPGLKATVTAPPIAGPAPADKLFDGVFLDQTSLAFMPVAKGMNIHYTLNGTIPTRKSPIYSKAINIKKTTTIKAMIFRKDGGKSIPARKPVVIKRRKTPYRTAVEVKNCVNGLRYNYYEGNWAVLPDFSKLKPVRSGKCDNFVMQEHRQDDFAFKFTGYFKAPKDGIYSFYTTSDDGSQLYIGDTLVVNNDGIHKPEEQAGQIALKAGLHPITVTMFEGRWGETLDVKFTAPGLSQKQISKELLFTERK